MVGPPAASRQPPAAFYPMLEPPAASRQPPFILSHRPMTVDMETVLKSGLERGSAAERHKSGNGDFLLYVSVEKLMFRSKEAYLDIGDSLVFVIDIIDDIISNVF
uniref:Uncharacterized protein n=1 Tax=Pristionchus pacificus TaxID=54126 RepID=A0A2A6CUR2_PRIPA|eukprot:PDM81787.1 hypothetical protein PRIPAC_37629 [Pristionchus pacificus]